MIIIVIKIKLPQTKWPTNQPTTQWAETGSYTLWAAHIQCKHIVFIAYVIKGYYNFVRQLKGLQKHSSGFAVHRFVWHVVALCPFDFCWTMFSLPSASGSLSFCSCWIGDFTSYSFLFLFKMETEEVKKHRSDTMNRLKFKYGKDVTHNFTTILKHKSHRKKFA